MIVETPDRLLWAVAETRYPGVWQGVPVRRARIRGTYERVPDGPFGRSTPRLISKAEARVVSQFRLRD